MSFATVLDIYCNTLGCTNKEIADKCGISPSALSRYRNGGRTPEVGSDTIDRIVTGLVALSHEHDVKVPLREDSVRNALEMSLSGSQVLGMSFGGRVGALMALLEIRNTEVAQQTGVSASYISRIRSGQRIPANQRQFAVSLSRLAARRCAERGMLAELVTLVESMGSAPSRAHLDLDSQSDLAALVEQWLMESTISKSDLDAVEILLKRLNDYYFIEELEKLEEIELPEPVEGQPEEAAYHFYTAQEKREAEKLFFEIAATYDTPEVYLCSDLPLLEKAIEPDFVETYRRLIGALILKKTRITAIHNTNRPFSEMVMALTMWIPLYLTGYVTPTYLKSGNDRLFYHANHVCSVCALTSEAVMGHEDDGYSCLTTRSEDLEYYQRKISYIMERVSSMVELYRDDNPEQRASFEAQEAIRATAGSGRVIEAPRFGNLYIVSYPGDCAVVTVLCDSPFHLVIRHPQLRFVIAHMR